MYICVSNTAFCELLCRHYCDDNRQAPRQTIASALLDVPSLPFLSASLFLVSNGTRSTDLLWVSSINILYPFYLLKYGMDAQPVCSFCLKTDGAPPTSTYACVSYNAPMYEWCSFCSCGKQEPRGGCFSRVSAVPVWLEANSKPLGVFNSH